MGQLQKSTTPAFISALQRSADIVHQYLVAGSHLQAIPPAIEEH
jgi:hypothetical protein